jgi:formate dehydrogenase subunit delta
MQVDKLVHMANRIGEFFASVPDRDEALAGIANHIAKFWAPGMRTALAAYIEQQQGAGLLPLVHEALRRADVMRP